MKTIHDVVLMYLDLNVGTKDCLLRMRISTQKLLQARLIANLIKPGSLQYLRGSPRTENHN